MIAQLIDLILHLDVHLAELSQQMGPWLYLILFSIIFAETGLVLFPILPGDSLLFAAGALAALPDSGLSVGLMWVLLVTAAIIGDNTNYTIGRWLGPKVFRRPKSWLMNPEYLRQAQAFYLRHGGKTVLFARFLPILRTFAPFVAGIGRMDRRSFVGYSASGTLLWISCFLGAGYGFGNIPWVKSNFSALIMAVLVLSVAPVIVGALQQRLNTARGAKGL